MPPAVEAVDNARRRAAAKRKTLGQVVGAFTDNYSLGAPPAPLGQTRASAPLVPPVGVGDDGQPVDLMTSGSIDGRGRRDRRRLPASRMPSREPADAGGAADRAGSSRSAPRRREDGANGLIDSAGQKVGALAKFQGFVQRFEKDGQTYFRARFGGFAGQDAANDMCKQLKQAKMSCLAMQRLGALCTTR